MLCTSTPSFGTCCESRTHCYNNVYAFCPLDFSPHLCEYQHVHQLPVDEFASWKEARKMETSIRISEFISRSIIYVAITDASHIIYDVRSESELVSSTTEQRLRIHESPSTELRRMDSVLQRYLCRLIEPGRVLRSSLDRFGLPRFGYLSFKDKLSYTTFACSRIPSIGRMVKIPSQESYHIGRRL